MSQREARLTTQGLENQRGPNTILKEARINKWRINSKKWSEDQWQQQQRREKETQKDIAISYPNCLSKKENEANQSGK